MTDVYGPQEATVNNVVSAITAAMQTRYADPGWRSAWEHVGATDDNHVRSVKREAATAAEAWSALNREGPPGAASLRDLSPSRRVHGACQGLPGHGRARGLRGRRGDGGRLESARTGRKGPCRRARGSRALCGPRGLAADLGAQLVERATGARG